MKNCIKVRRTLPGLIGLLSLLGLIGIFTEERSFLAFFCFAIDFSYFFLKTDEMSEAYMDRAASNAFYCGMIATAVVSLICFFAAGLPGHRSLLYGFAAGWGVSAAVHGFSIGFYQLRESWGLDHDHE